MIYGYGKQRVDEPGLLEMSEVTFCESSLVLREIAHFLTTIAQRIDDGSFGKSSHVHIDTVIEGWRSRFPDTDIIVMPCPVDHRE